MSTNSLRFALKALMNQRNRTSLLGLSLLAATVGLLSGCAGDVIFTNDVTPATAKIGNVGITNMGGHAPLVGAHLFLLEATPAATGYYQASKSLLKSTYNAGNGTIYATAKEPSGTAMAGNYYVTTDSHGYALLSGDYTCDAGYPVYVYGQGGNPQAPGAYQTSVNITGATIAAGTGTYAGSYVITFTASSLVYQGESLTFSGTGAGNLGAFLNGVTQTVLPDANLTTTTFDVAVSSLTNNGVTLSTGTQSFTSLSAVQALAPNNPAVVNLAVLGLCPDSGTANFSYLTNVYMNEVSTAAAAYALAGFFPPPGTSGLAVAGAVAGNLSVPATSPVTGLTDTLALTGLQNAALTATQLYDIQGTNSSCSGTTPPCDGETHVARTTTPGILVVGTTASGSKTISNVLTNIGASLNVGMPITGANLPANTTITALGASSITVSANATANGTAVQMFAGSGAGTITNSVLNTVGNVLANCVDSANTSSTTSAQCSVLFGYAKSAGTSGTTPVDTASAAIDIAHNPWANANNLASLPTGNTPFAPLLATSPAVNDLSVGISYTPLHVSFPEGIAIDKNGNIWYANENAAAPYVTALNPVGGVLYNVNVGGLPHYVVIDSQSNKLWLTNTGVGIAGLQDINATTGVLDATSYGGTFFIDYGIAADGGTSGNRNGYIYAGGGTDGVYKFNDSTGAITNPGNPFVSSQPPNCTGVTSGAAHIAVDNHVNTGYTGYNVWAAEENGPVCEMDNSTATAPIEVVALAATVHPETISFDSNSTAWIPESGTNKVIQVTQGGVVTTLTGTLSTPFGSAIDGAGNAFITNRGNNGVTEYLSTTTGSPVSTVNFKAGGLLSDPLNIMADGSGNLWITNYNSSKIVELLGVAAPTWQPLADAGFYTGTAYTVQGGQGSKP